MRDGKCSDVCYENHTAVRIELLNLITCKYMLVKLTDGSLRVVPWYCVSSKVDIKRITAKACRVARVSVKP